MSQSDYINFKKRTIILENLNTLPSVLTSELYTAFTKYNLETTVLNRKIVYSCLKNNDNNRNLPRFTLCKDTDKRPNRIKNTIQYPVPIDKWKIFTFCT